MKDLTFKELLKKYRDEYFFIESEEIKDEILKRYEILEKEILELRPIYCAECGSCGEEGCCPPDRCKDLNKHLKCLYGIEYAKTYKELLDENDGLNQENKNLKCCGNCAHHYRYCQHELSYECCRQWQSDTMVQEERTHGFL